MMKTKNIKYILFLLLTITLCPICQAQETRDATEYTLSFHDYLTAVSKNNLSYLSEKYEVDIAEAEVIAQKVLPDPELLFEGTNDQYKLGLGYTLELGNKRGARVRLARSQAELQKLALEYYFHELRAEAANLFIDAMQQKELLDLKKSSYEYMLQLSRTDSTRFVWGEITEIDAHQTRLEASILLNDVYEQEAVYKSSLALLNQSMGKRSDTLQVPQGSWEVHEKDYLLPQLFELGLTNRIDLYAAHKNIEVAINQQKQVRAERKIDLGLTAEYERDWRGFLPPSKSYVLGVSIPLKFSNFNKGSIKAAEFGVEQSKVQQQNLELQIQSEISQAYFSFDATKKKVKQYQGGLLEQSQKILDAMVKKYRIGDTSILEVLVAQRTYIEVQEQYLETRKDYASALINLQKTCGIWDIDL